MIYKEEGKGRERYFHDSSRELRVGFRGIIFFDGFIWRGLKSRLGIGIVRRERERESGTQRGWVGGWDENERMAKAKYVERAKLWLGVKGRRGKSGNYIFDNKKGRRGHNQTKATKALNVVVLYSYGINKTVSSFFFFLFFGVLWVRVLVRIVLSRFDYLCKIIIYYYITQIFKMIKTSRLRDLDWTWDLRSPRNYFWGVEGRDKFSTSSMI